MSWQHCSSICLNPYLMCSRFQMYFKMTNCYFPFHLENSHKPVEWPRGHLLYYKTIHNIIYTSSACIWCFSAIRVALFFQYIMMYFEMYILLNTVQRVNTKWNPKCWFIFPSSFICIFCGDFCERFFAVRGIFVHRVLKI